MLAKSIAGLVVPLGRLDALVFTGGIGENSATVRARTVGHLGFLGLAARPGRQRRPRAGAAAAGSPMGMRPQALVVPTNEELMIAMDTAEIARRA